MNVVRILEITEEKQGKRKRELEDGSVVYTPWHWRKFKGETSIEGEAKTFYASTFEHIEKGTLYEGNLTQEDYKGKRQWKFENVKPWVEETPKGKTNEPPLTKETLGVTNVPPASPSVELKKWAVQVVADFRKHETNKVEIATLFKDCDAVIKYVLTGE